MKYPIVFIINGYPGSGKDTFVNMVTEYGVHYNKYEKFKGSLNQGYLTINSSTVDIIKKVAKELGWNGEKTPEARKFLADLKKLSVDFNDFPNKKLISDIKAARNTKVVRAEDGYVFSKTFDSHFKFWFIHCREPEEIDKLKSQIGEDCFTIFVLREKHEGNLSNDADKNVENYNYDYYIDNSGTLEDLDEKVYLFLKQFDS